MDVSEYNEIVQYWIRKVLENRGKDAEATLKYSNDIIHYGLKQGDNWLLGFGYFYSGETHYYLNDGTHFFEAVSQALAYLERVGEWELMAKSYNILGIWAMNRGNVPIALDYYMNGIHYSQTYHLDEQESLLNINVSILNMQCGRYQEAQIYLERAFRYVSTVTNHKEYHTYMVSIYTNLAKCMRLQKQYAKVEEIYQKIYQHHWDHIQDMDRIPVLCSEAIYYHQKEDKRRRNQCIQQIESHVNEHIVILDMFDDYYDYVQMLLDAEEESAFWHIIDILEPLVKSCNIINLQLKLISIKLHYYRKYKKNAEYLQESGLYYELSELMGQETSEMINNVLNMRKGLENANRVRREMELQNRILLEKSEMDPLTRLANRFRLNDYSEEIFERASKIGTTLTVEILDIDYFKEYNDNYGHQEGDNCLIQVAEVLKSMEQDYGAFCARYGGDEFVLLYEGFSKKQSFCIAGELKKRILDRKLVHEYSKAFPFVTISQGLCWGVPQKGNRMWDFLHTADSMLYRVKKISRNNYGVDSVDRQEEVMMGQEE